MGRIILALVILGGFLVFWGVQEIRLSGSSKSEPQNITCAQLAKSGPGDNSHVHLTDFIVCDAAYVYKGKKDGSSFETVWVPLLPNDESMRPYFLEVLKAQKANQPPPMPRDIKIIVQSSKVKSEAQMDNFAELSELEGTVVNNISSLGREERKILESSYPGVDFEHAYIVEHDRHPSTMKGFGMVGGGVSLAGIGVLLVMKRRAA